MLNDADLPGLPSGVGSDEDLGHWFEDHIKRVRHYFETSELAERRRDIPLTVVREKTHAMTNYDNHSESIRSHLGSSL